MGRLASKCGFSLVELAVVLVIISAIAGASIGLGGAQQKVARIKASNAVMEVIKTALTTYHLKNGRYPCPAVLTQASTHASYGLEATGCDSACPAGLICNGASIQGFVPFKTIGLSEALAYDAWGGRIRYVVDNTHVVSSTYANGTLAIQDANGNEITNSTVLGKAIYILLSHGSDRKGAYNKAGALMEACGAAALDSENCDGDAILTSTTVTEIQDINAASYFQDFLNYESQSNLDFNSLFNIRFKQIDSSATHSCGITLGGKLYCWGINGNGQLGNNTTTNSFIPVEVNGNFSDWVEITVAERFSCGIRASLRAYCWGENINGQLGDNTNSQRNIPTEVGTTLTSTRFTDWSKITAGDHFACGIRTNGLGYCWGRNGVGQRGDGTISPSLVPSPIGGGITNWVKIASGEDSTCGITSGGRAYCWGDVNNVTTLLPSEVSGCHTDWVEINIGSDHHCGIRSSGRAYCWGDNSQGQLGDNTIVDKVTPNEVFGTHTDWIAIVTGVYHSCGIRSSGRTYCWGSNDWSGTNFGMLGDGTMVDKLVPTEISGALNDWSRITGSDAATCAIRLNGLSYCWGNNVNGIVGDGTTVDKLVPTLISNP